MTGSHMKDPETSNDAQEAASPGSPGDPQATSSSSSSTDDPLSLLDALEEDPAVDPTIPRVARRAQASASCSQCNRAFCLSQSLPICKGAAEKDVVTMCFQRDSRQDQIIVWGFILGTAGLLGYAALRKVLEMQESGAGLAGGLAGGLLRGGSREPGAMPGGRGGIGGMGGDGARGRYATVAGHSRDSSGVM